MKSSLKLFAECSGEGIIGAFNGVVTFPEVAELVKCEPFYPYYLLYTDSDVMENRLNKNNFINN